MNGQTASPCEGRRKQMSDNNQTENDKLRIALSRCLSVMEAKDFRTCICVCGRRMDEHGSWSDHSFEDAGEKAAKEAQIAAKDALWCRPDEPSTMTPESELIRLREYYAACEDIFRTGMFNARADQYARRLAAVASLVPATGEQG